MNVLHLYLDDLRLRDFLPPAISRGSLAGAVIFPSGQTPPIFRENLLLHLKEEFMGRSGALIIREGEPRLEILRLLESARADILTWTRPRRPESSAVLTAVLREVAGLRIQLRGFDDVPTRSRYPLINGRGEAVLLFKDFFDQWLDERETPLAARPPALLGWTDFSNWQPVPDDDLPRSGPAALQLCLRRLPRIGNLQREFSAGGTGVSRWLVHGAVSRRELTEGLLQSATVPGLGVPAWILLRRLGRGEYIRHLAAAFPDAFAGGHQDERYWQMRLNMDASDYRAWCEGRTGVPIVDAAMRQLQTDRGLSHILRLCVAVHLVQVLGMDWRLGDQWFQGLLDDYDPVVSRWHWQRIAGAGFRSGQVPVDFAIEQVVRELDSDCSYIRRWLPEWKKVPAGEIHLANHRGGPEGKTLGKCQAEYRIRLRDAGIGNG